MVDQGVAKRGAIFVPKLVYRGMSAYCARDSYAARSGHTARGTRDDRDGGIRRFGAAVLFLL